MSTPAFDHWWKDFWVQSPIVSPTPETRAVAWAIWQHLTKTPLDPCAAGLYRLARECGWSEASARPPELYIRDKLTNAAPQVPVTEAGAQDVGRHRAAELPAVAAPLDAFVASQREPDDDLRRAAAVAAKQAGEPVAAPERRDGHSALRVRDGELETFDPHPETNPAPQRVEGQTTAHADEPGNPEPGAAVAGLLAQFPPHGSAESLQREGEPVAAPSETPPALTPPGVADICRMQANDAAFRVQRVQYWYNADYCIVKRSELDTFEMALDRELSGNLKSNLSADLARYKRIRDGLTTDDFQKLLEIVDDGSWLGAGKALKQGASLDVAIDSLTPQSGKS